MFKIKSIPVNIMLAVFFTFAAFSYIAFINFNAGFLTGDDFSYVIKDREEQWIWTLQGDRASHYIAFYITDFIGFHVPDFLGLLPRYITQILLFSSLAAIFVRLKLSVSLAFFAALFVITTHEIDWQHNGFIAFFGGFNLFFALFFFAVLIERSDVKLIIAWPIVFLFVFISFSSELFFGLAIIYIFLCVILNEKLSSIAASPFFWAIILYISLYLYIQGNTTQSQEFSMQNYLMGGLYSHGVKDLLQAGLLFYLHSIPHLKESEKIFFIVILILPVVLFFIKDFFKFLIKVYSPKHIEQNAIDKTPFILLALIMIAGVAPQFLMAIQPTKFEWIMSGASNRYAFSLYGWISMGVIFFYYFNRLDKKHTKIRIFSFALMGLIILSSAQSNYLFIKPYAESKIKWLEIYNKSISAEGDTVMLNTHLLRHPYILPIDEYKIGRYVYRLSGKKVSLCHFTNGYFLFSDPEPDTIKIEGFHQAEADGRWANETAELTIIHAFIEGGEVEIFFNGGFNIYHDNPIIITYGGDTYSHVPKIDSSFKINLEPGTSNPTITLSGEQATSPYTLGQSHDTRNISAKVKAISAHEINNGNLIKIFSCE